MGKTESGAVWLDEKYLSAYDYWQFWRNTDDRDVIKFLNFFSEIDISEISKIKNNNINDLKVLLANKATEMLHGKKAAENSEKTAKETFSENSTGHSLPSIDIKTKNIKKEINIIDLVILSKLEDSKSEVRRLIKGNAIKIDNKIINDEKFILNESYFNNNYLKLSIGKKRHIKIKFN